MFPKCQQKAVDNTLVPMLFLFYLLMVLLRRDTIERNCVHGDRTITILCVEF